MEGGVGVGRTLSAVRVQLHQYLFPLESHNDAEIGDLKLICMIGEGEGETERDKSLLFQSILVLVCVFGAKAATVVPDSNSFYSRCLDF